MQSQEEGQENQPVNEVGPEEIYDGKVNQQPEIIVLPENPEPDQEVPGPSEQKPKKSKKPLIITLVVILVLVLAGAGFYYWQQYRSDASSAPVAKKTTTPQKSIATEPVDPILAAFTTPKTGEKWLASPKQITTRLGYYTGDNGDGVDECTMMTYSEVGSRGDSTIILGYLPACVGDGGGISYLFERTKDGKVSYISHPIGNGDYTKYSDGSPVRTSDALSIAKSVTVDSSTHYDSLTAPKSLPFGSNQTVSVNLNFPQIGVPITSTVTDGIKTTQAATYGQSKLQKIERAYTDTKLTAINYALDLPTNTEKDVTYAPITTDLSAYTWNNGVVVAKSNATTGYSSEIHGAVRGCGSVQNAVTRVDDAKDADFVEAGKTPSGQMVYAFKDSNNHVVQALYKDYKMSLDGSGTTAVSIDEFMKQHAIVAYKDADGAWLVYSRDQFALYGGCGKPVVYLYPTKTQAVNVRVGADVTVSAPKYAATTGWNVIAQPNGQLNVNGQQFDSLFWEGVGHGLYPGITAGTVVKRADAVSTIKAQLLKQGLNQKETSDFLAFWQPKIPNDPYIRLTWLNTSQMNELAPLNITPKPDTTLRVFLDMAGYSSPVKIPAQKLTSTARKGFTVVEWGGLLAGTPAAQ